MIDLEPDRMLHPKDWELIDGLIEGKFLPESDEEFRARRLIAYCLKGSSLFFDESTRFREAIARIFENNPDLIRRMRDKR